jgi:hypothetical protein
MRGTPGKDALLAKRPNASRGHQLVGRHTERRRMIEAEALGRVERRGTGRHPRAVHAGQARSP